MHDSLDAADVCEASELRLTRPARACVDAMRLAGTVDDAVVIGDAVLHAGLTSRRQLENWIEAHPGMRGIKRARLATMLVDPAARSPFESRLRVFWVRDLGLPPPTVNARIFDGRTGELVAIVDLLDEEAGTATEFDGQHHRERRQHRADNIREERLESLNLIVVRVDSLDLLPRGRPQLSWRLQAARRRGLARDRDRDLWTTG
jgi:hypothetical protein